MLEAGAGSPTSALFQVLNAIGLGGVGAGIVFMYRALSSRGDLLSQNLADLKKAHESIVDTMKKRAEDIDSRFEDEKKFRSLYLSLVEDAVAHKEKIRMWKDDELSVLQGKFTELSTRVRQLEDEIHGLKVLNRALKGECDELRTEYSKIASNNHQLANELRDERSARGFR
ncbi:MAG: hypothetical protein DMG32_17205 [Acidobacteria bacterium]|nr:MAG: hypothetical protein DMG32_17205 [Acidobacteriota bacterium]